MLFGLSLVKIAVVLTLAVLLFAVPLMTLLVILKERRERRRPGTRPGRRDR
jgi:predicted HTH domain antitoxin